MNRKSLFILALAFIFSLLLISSAVQAGGGASGYSGKGIAIGDGDVIVEDSTIRHNRPNIDSPSFLPPRHTPSNPGLLRPPRHRHFRRGFRPPKHRPRHGRWTMRKEWIPPSYKRVWNPGHYDSYGVWVAAGWIEVPDRPGYWIKRWVWVDHRGYRRYANRYQGP